MNNINQTAEPDQFLAVLSELMEAYRQIGLLEATKDDSSGLLREKDEVIVKQHSDLRDLRLHTDALKANLLRLLQTADLALAEIFPAGPIEAEAKVIPACLALSKVVQSIRDTYSPEDLGGEC